MNTHGKHSSPTMHRVATHGFRAFITFRFRRSALLASNSFIKDLPNSHAQLLDGCGVGGNEVAAVMFNRVGAFEVASGHEIMISVPSSTS